jgi:hypothetical protein
MSITIKFDKFFIKKKKAFLIDQCDMKLGKNYLKVNIPIIFKFNQTRVALFFGCTGLNLRRLVHLLKLFSNNILAK